MRSIPTCAGQPASPVSGTQPQRVYPHVCGAAMPEDERPSDDEGLSPRVRGSRYEVRPPVVAQRSIPTCAGQPVYSFGMDGLTQVYPHVCGAALRVGGQRRYGNGLSPRVRGSHDEISGTGWKYRSIPTCAGQPVHCNRHADRVEVYPHVCGAADISSSFDEPPIGLSPRVRGSRVIAPTSPMATMRSIPTCAGQPRHTMSLPVYPHVCGAAKYALSFSSSGLSPRVRGSPILCSTCNPMARWVYPHVCGAAPRYTHPQSSGVYPHVCGAAGFYLLEAIPWVGLSPRVRGSRHRTPTACAKHETGSIPTCAGQPHWAAMPLFDIMLRSIPTCAGQPVREVITRCKKDVCGAAICVQLTPNIGDGLSPRVRGSP